MRILHSMTSPHGVNLIFWSVVAIFSELNQCHSSVGAVSDQYAHIWIRPACLRAVFVELMQSCRTYTDTIYRSVSDPLPISSVAFWVQIWIRFVPVCCGSQPRPNNLDNKPAREIHSHSGQSTEATVCCCYHVMVSSSLCNSRYNFKSTQNCINDRIIILLALQPQLMQLLLSLYSLSLFYCMQVRLPIGMMWVRLYHMMCMDVVLYTSTRVSWIS